MKAERKGILLMTLCALMWSIAGVMFKYIPWHPMAIAGSRAFFGGLAVLVYVLISKTPFVLNRQTLLTGVSMCACCTLFVLGNKMTTAANAIVLQYTAPVFLLLYSVVFLGKRFRRLDVVAVLFTLAGITLFFFDQMDAGQMTGNLLSVAAGATMGLMYMSMGEGTPAERFSGILLCEAINSAIGLPFFIGTEPDFSFIPVLFIIILGVFQLGIPYMLYAKASETCPALACSLLAALEPLLSPIWVLIFYGEKPGVFALIGGTVVISTITLWCIIGNRKDEEGATHEPLGEPAGKSE